MNWFITTLCLIAIGKGAFSEDDYCKYLEPGKYPAGDCDHYILCTGKKGSGVGGGVKVACPAGTKLEKYQRECIAEHLVDCKWCFFAYQDYKVEDPTSKAHFFGCVGPQYMQYVQRYRCRTPVGGPMGEFEPATFTCSDASNSYAPDDHKDKKAFAEEARKLRPTGECRPCRSKDTTAKPATLHDTTVKTSDDGEAKS